MPSTGPRQVDATTPIGLPPPPKVDVPIDASPRSTYYRIIGAAVGHWYAGEIVEAEELGDVTERSRLLSFGVIEPVVGTPEAAPISRAAAWERTGPMAPIRPPTIEEIVTKTVAALKAP